MKGIVLAGGHATRLYPLTKVTNKHLLPVGKVPMIYWPVARLLEARIRDIMIITSRDHMGDIVGQLGSGTELGARFTYRVQDQAGGIAQALGLCESFVGGDSCCVILGDNIFTKPLTEGINSCCGARVFLKKVPDPQRYGVAEVSEQGEVIDIVEKPKKPTSKWAVTGCYIYDNEVFNIVRALKPSKRGELEITDVNNYYIRENSMSWIKVQGDWTDAGTFDSLLHANKLVHDIPVPDVLKPIMEKA